MLAPPGAFPLGLLASSGLGLLGPRGQAFLAAALFGLLLPLAIGLLASPGLGVLAHLALGFAGPALGVLAALAALALPALPLGPRPAGIVSAGCARGGQRDLEPGRLVACLDAAHSVSPRILHDPDEDDQRGRLVVDWRQVPPAAILRHPQAVTQQGHDLRKVAAAEALWVEGDPEIHPVVVRHVLCRYAVCVLGILHKGLHQEVQLVAPSEEHPILVLPVGVHRRSPTVRHVEVGLWQDPGQLGVGGGLLVLLVLCHIILLPLLHVLPRLVPGLELLLEPLPGLQAVEDQGGLLGSSPLLQVFIRLALRGPHVLHAVEALLLGWQRETRVGLVDYLGRHVRPLVLRPCHVPDTGVQRLLVGLFVLSLSIIALSPCPLPCGLLGFTVIRLIGVLLWGIGLALLLGLILRRILHSILSCLLGLRLLQPLWPLLGRIILLTLALALRLKLGLLCQQPPPPGLPLSKDAGVYPVLVLRRGLA
mmetsp:Transcript_42652/g.135503  ORF Transcript_42652/g.135503 Transcript_42652/m.135503 type:complete len:479 (-) Transcript_42652:382-1818(-)